MFKSRLLIISMAFLGLAVVSSIAYEMVGGGECIPISNEGCYINDTIFMPIGIISVLIAGIFLFAFLLNYVIKQLINKNRNH